MICFSVGHQTEDCPHATGQQGWFVVDGEILGPYTEHDALAMARDEEGFSGYQIFWSRERAEAELNG
jgi:hypothetical protein